MFFPVILNKQTVSTARFTLNKRVEILSQLSHPFLIEFIEYSGFAVGKSGVPFTSSMNTPLFLLPLQDAFSCHIFSKKIGFCLLLLFFLYALFRVPSNHRSRRTKEQVSLFVSKKKTLYFSFVLFAGNTPISQKPRNVPAP